MMVYGHENQLGSKCIKWNANVSACGREWVCGEINDEVENYCLVNDAILQLQSRKYRDKIATIIEKARADAAKSGIIDKDPLFVYWDMRNIKVPTLHIRLGLGNELLYAIRDFIRNYVEIDLDEIIGRCASHIARGGGWFER